MGSSSPRFRVKIKNIWNHHPVDHCDDVVLSGTTMLDYLRIVPYNSPKPELFAIQFRDGKIFEKIRPVSSPSQYYITTIACRSSFGNGSWVKGPGAALLAAKKTRRWFHDFRWSVWDPWGSKGLLDLTPTSRINDKHIITIWWFDGVMKILKCPIYILVVVGGWTNPSEKICSSKWESFPK